MASSSPEQTRVFGSLQLTTKALAKLQQLRKDSATGVEVRLSSPAFNVVKGVNVPAEFLDCQYNAPCFGVRIPGAIMDLFDDSLPLGKELCTIAKELGFRLPAYQLSDTVTSKMKKVRLLIDEAKKQGIDQKAVDKLTNFVDEVANAKGDGLTIKSWRQMIARHVGEGWEDQLHFDKVLRLFGIDEEASKRLRETQVPNESGSFEQYSVRWLSKAFSAFGPIGCLTDVLNLIFVLKNNVSNKALQKMEEKDIEKAVLDFKGDLSLALAGDISKLQEFWMPTKVAMDCEMDDTLALVILLFVHKKLQQGRGGPALEVHAQLPQLPVSDDVTLHHLQHVVQHFQLIESKCLVVHAFHDEESRNRVEMLRNFPEAELERFQEAVEQCAAPLVQSSSATA